MPPISYDEAHGAPAGYYPAASAAPVGLPPHLEAAVQQQKAMAYGDQREPVCTTCRSAYAPGQGTVNGYCAHRAGPGIKAVELAEARRAAATRLAQQLAAGQLGNPARVVDVGQAAQEDAMRASWHAAIEELFT